MKKKITKRNAEVDELVERQRSFYSEGAYCVFIPVGIVIVFWAAILALVYC